MTCPQALSLLEDYIDGELSAAQTADVQQHLDECDSCRQEYADSLRLKEILKQSQDDSRLPDPGEDYWSEVSSLILARTVESDHPVQSEEVYTRVRPSSEERRTLVRSLMLFAASLVLMLGAIYVGSQRPHFSTALPQTESEVYLTAALSDVVASDHNTIVTKEEEQTLVRGMMALSAPGPVGRFGSLTDLIGSY